MPGFAWRTPQMFAASAETEDDGRCVGDRANGELRREVRETPLPSPAHPDGAKANACTSTDVSFRRIAHHPTAQGMCAESCGLFEDRSFGLACADDRRDADGVKLVFDASSFELCPLRGRPVGDNTHLESLGAKRSDCDDHFRLRCVLRWILDAVVGKQVVNRNPDTQLRPQLCKELLTGLYPSASARSIVRAASSLSPWTSRKCLVHKTKACSRSRRVLSRSNNARGIRNTVLATRRDSGDSHEQHPDWFETERRLSLR